MATQRREQADEGRWAETPGDIPARGWKQVGKRVLGQIKEDKLTMVAAALAYYATLSIFPALIAAISIYGLFTDPQQVAQQIDNLTNQLSPEAAQILEQQLNRIATASTTALSSAFAVSVLGALWTTSSGVQQLILAVDVAYEEEETRGFLRLRGLALVLALGAILAAGIALVLVVAAPPLLAAIGLTGELAWFAHLGRFLLLAVLAAAGLAVLYRYAPDRDDPRWQWVSWGSGIAALLWVVASIGFSFYVANFGNFDRTYGVLAGFIILMLWFFITGVAVMLGAEINSELEHQTAADTTVGEPRPMGRRRAVKADSVSDD